QRAEAAHADGREVHEHVLAGVGRDEAEALRVVEPLDRALDPALRRARGRRGPHRARAAGAASAAAAAVAGAGAPARAAALRGVEAVATQHRTPCRGHERHLGVAPAVRAGRGIHLLVAAARIRAAAAAGATRRPATGLALLAAVLAARGLVRQPALAVERLLTGREQELLTAIHTGDALVLSARHDFCEPPERKPERMLLQRGRPRHERPGG